MDISNMVVLKKNKMYKENKDKANDIIINFDKKFKKQESSILVEFEAKLKDEFATTHQGIKEYINGLYNDGICQEICYKYAKKNEVVEFKLLIKDYESKNINNL